jgi:hypothetical protein
VADGYQLQRATDSLFTSNLVSINIAGKRHQYNDAGLNPGTKYWYRVRAKSGAVFSDFSNRARIITPQQIVYVNFNYAVPSVGAPWNNLEALPNFVETYPNMLDQSGITTNVTLAIVSTFNGEFNAGKQTGNNSGIVPDNVLAANYWLDNTQLSQINVSGLNHLKRYRFGFFGSSGPEGWFKGNYTATYTINDRTVYLNSWENTTKIVYIGDVQPDENGEVMLNFSTTLAANYGFNGGVLIEAYDDVNGGGQLNQVNPSKLDTKELVETAGNSQAIAQQSEFRIYPNPFVDYLNLDFFNTSASDQISVEVFDMAGRLTYRKLFGKLAAGYNSLKIATQDNKLGAGVYMVTLSANGKIVKSAKMVKTQK